MSAHKAQTLHNNAINWYTSHRLIKKTMFHCLSLGLQKELHQNSGIFSLIYTNTYQHKFRPTHTNTNILPNPTNIHQNYGIFPLIPTHLMTHFPPHLFSQPKEVSSRVAAHLSSETTLGK